MHRAANAPTPPGYDRVAMRSRGKALSAALRRNARVLGLGLAVAAATWSISTIAVVRLYDDRGSLAGPPVFDVLALVLNVVLLGALFASARAAARRRTR